MQARSLRPVTIDERLRVLRSLETHCGTVPHEVAAGQIAEWLAGGQWSASTRATYHGYLKAWFDWLQSQDLRDDNPLVKIPAPRTPRRRPRPIDDQHMNRLLATRMHAKTRAMILLAALEGLRVHEIAKVKGEDVDLIAGILHVVGKGGVVDELPLHPLVAEVARELPRRGYWFPANSRAAVPGTCVRSKSVSDIIAGVMRRAEVPGTPHSLRHWFGTTLVDSGVDLRTAQELLRHASLATTQIYTKVSSKRRVEGINKLDPWRAITPAEAGVTV